MRLNKLKKQKGFTLIELLVSVALFSIVMTIGLGAIITISDVNKKARSLMSVMNNLNFAVDSMTRSFKAGEIKGTSNNGNTCFQTKETIYPNVTGANRFVEYCYDQDDKTITKQTGNSGTPVPLTSPDVVIEYAHFEVYGTEEGEEQPILVIVLEGEVRISEKVSSDFSIHTSVAQRKLNI